MAGQWMWQGFTGGVDTATATMNSGQANYYTGRDPCLVALQQYQQQAQMSQANWDDHPYYIKKRKQLAELTAKPSPSPKPPAPDPFKELSDHQFHGLLDEFKRLKGTR